MTLPEFEYILNSTENLIVDFKAVLYDFNLEDKANKNAEFVKDIISLSNTIRDKNAYIVFGVKIYPNGQKRLCGIEKYPDDAIFQQKIKDKVNIIPKFLSYNFSYNNLDFGIIEIPVVKYHEPIMPIVRMKGLEPLKVYLRRGTSNSEALPKEIHEIYNWLDSIPSNFNNSSIYIPISLLIKKISFKNSRISEYLPEIFEFANTHNLIDLKRLCSNEINGWFDVKFKEEDAPFIKYRTAKTLVSIFDFEINPYSSFTSTQLLNEMKKEKGFYSMDFFFPHSVLEIEQIIDRFNENPNSSIITFTTKADKLFDNKDFADYPLKVIADKHSFENIYTGIKQKIIKELTNIIGFS